MSDDSDSRRLKAEDDIGEDALDLHRSLGRDEDVRRVLQAREVDR